MQQHESTFEKLNTRIVVVTFEATPFTRAYVAETKIGWPIVIDRDRRLYRHYGMHRGRLLDIWGPSTWLAYLKELAHGRRPKAPSDDTRQLGGDVLIDPAGIVRFHYVGRGPADRPSVATILTARQEQR